MYDFHQIKSWFMSGKSLPLGSKLVSEASYCNGEKNPMTFRRNVTLCLEGYKHSNPYSGFFDFLNDEEWEIKFELSEIMRSIINEKFETEVDTSKLSHEPGKKSVDFIHSPVLTGVMEVSKCDDDAYHWHVDILLSLYQS